MTNPSWHIPDPDTQPEFYSDVPTKRLIAWIIDTSIIIVISLLIVPFTAFTGLFFFPALVLTIGFIYRIVTLARSSATPGMWLTAIEFRTRQGQKFDLPMASLHTLGFTVSCGFIFPQVASIVLMLTTARAQGLSDHLLGTVAINRRASF